MTLELSIGNGQLDASLRKMVRLDVYEKLKNFADQKKRAFMIKFALRASAAAAFGASPLLVASAAAAAARQNVV